MSAPLPAEVTPSTKPTTTPRITARTFSERPISTDSRSRPAMRFRNSARASVITPQNSRVIASARISVSSKASP